MLVQLFYYKGECGMGLQVQNTSVIILHWLTALSLLRDKPHLCHFSCFFVVVVFCKGKCGMVYTRKQKCTLADNVD